MLLGHLDSFVGRSEKLVKDMNGYIEFFKELEGKEVGYFYSQLTALCSMYIYSTMRGWAAETKKVISERGADS